MFVSSRTNLHTCTLPLAGSRSPLVKYARGSHIGFSSTSQTRSCALRMPRYVTFTVTSETVSECPTCRKYEVANPAEPLMVHEVHDRPWAKVGVDLFKFADRDYFCTLDYMSNFWEIDHLQNTEAKTVITKLKHHFVRHGIPDRQVTDNGPQFSSRDFSTFAKKWCFTHTPVSPCNSKANGKVESAVKMAKNLSGKRGKISLIHT